jgi:hypothetical protein
MKQPRQGTIVFLEAGRSDYIITQSGIARTGLVPPEELKRSVFLISFFLLPNSISTLPSNPSNCQLHRPFSSLAHGPWLRLLTELHACTNELIPNTQRDREEQAVDRAVRQFPPGRHRTWEEEKRARYGTGHHNLLFFVSCRSRRVNRVWLKRKKDRRQETKRPFPSSKHKLAASLQPHLSLRHSACLDNKPFRATLSALPLARTRPEQRVRTRQESGR